MYPKVECPKCGRLLPPDGEVTFRGAVIPTYCCPECVTRTTLMGESMELPLIFILGPDGRAFEPADPDGELDLTAYE
jgi:hypothetical protein